jgi:ABC-2 type transport system permease protein
MLYRILALIRKEFLSILRDPKSRMIIILPLFTQLFIFAFAVTLDVDHVSIGIYNRDNGKESFDLIQRFEGSPTFHKFTHINSQKELDDFVDRQKGILVLSIDETFSKKLNEGGNPQVQLILDGRKSNTAQIVVGYAQEIIKQYENEFIQAKDPFYIPSITLIPNNKYNPNLIYLWFTVPGLLAILSMLQALVITALSVAREKELGTFDQLLVSPLTSLEILIGKTVPAIVIGIFAGTAILLAGIFIFQIPFTGSFLLLYLSLFVYVCSIVGVGLFLSSLCHTQQQAVLATFVFMTPAVILSGFATPIENMPQWLQYATYLNPAKYFLIISRGLFLKQMPFAIVMHNLWPIALMALGTLSFAGFFFHVRHQ